MSGRRVLFSSLSMGEALRFLLFFLLLVSLLFQPVRREPRLILWLLLAAGAQLLPVAGLLLVAYDYRRYHVLLKLLALGKGINLFTGALVLVAERTTPQAHQLQLSLFARPLSVPVLLGAIIAVDLVFFTILLLTAGRRVPELDPAEPQAGPEARPVFSEDVLAPPDTHDVSSLK